MIGPLDSVLFSPKERSGLTGELIFSWQVPFSALLFSNFVSGEFGVIQIDFYCSIGTHSIILLCGW